MKSDCRSRAGRTAEPGSNGHFGLRPGARAGLENDWHRRRGRPRFGLRHYVRARLHRRLFVAMGVAIFVSLLLSLTLSLWFSHRPLDFNPDAAQDLISSQFSRVWNDHRQRSALADRSAVAFSVSIRLLDDRGRTLSRHGPEACEKPRFSIPVRADSGRKQGVVGVCMGSHRGFHAPWVIAPLLFGFFLWIAAGVIAHRLGRPLGKLVETTQDIGRGQLSSRARLGRHEAGELGILAESINDMAARIEKQLDDQKELLAAVSHEMRTPLSRLRVISELLDSEGASTKLTHDMQREIIELDDLIGQLLANSRLEFHALRKEKHDAREVALLALTRAGLSADLLRMTPQQSAKRELLGDATLLVRAILNLLHNAQMHASGVQSLHLMLEAEDRVEFSVEDRGPGFAKSDLHLAFDPFYRGKSSGKSAGTLGLGLSLVRRIAQAHGGDARAENRTSSEGGGARVSFWVSRG